MVFIIAGAAIGAGIGVLAARGKNKRLQEVALRRQRRVNQKITQMRVNRLIAMDSLARAGRVALGDSLNAAPHNLAVVETLASRVVANVARDQDTIDINLERGELASEAEKQDIAAETSSQTQNPILAGLTGALQGALTGASFASAIGSAVQAGQENEILKGVGASNVDIAKSRAAFATSQAGKAGEFLNLARATTARITSRISSSAVQQTFSNVHLPSFSRGSTRLPGPAR